MRIISVLPCVPHSNDVMVRHDVVVSHDVVVRHDVVVVALCVCSCRNLMTTNHHDNTPSLQHHPNTSRPASFMRPR